MSKFAITIGAALAALTLGTGCAIVAPGAGQNLHKLKEAAEELEERLDSIDERLERIEDRLGIEREDDEDEDGEREIEGELERLERGRDRARRDD